MKVQIANDRDSLCNSRKRGFSIEDVAVMYGLSRQKVYDEVNAGRLKSFKVGKRRIIALSALEQWENGEAVA